MAVRKSIRIRTRPIHEGEGEVSEPIDVDDARRLLPTAFDPQLPSPQELELAQTTSLPDLAHIVRKSNELVRAHYSLSLNATRLLAYALAVVDSDEVKKQQHFPLLSIPLPHIAEVFPALQSNNDIKEVMRAACADLFQASIEIQVGKKQEKISLRWAPTCGLAEGHVHLRLHYDLAPYLLDLKERYTSQSLMYVVELRSSYQYRLYEIFRSYLFRLGCELRFDELKSMLGIEEGQYQLVGHFASRVLNPGLQAINAVTDVHVEIDKPIRTGKKIIGWSFRIRRQIQRKLPLSPMNAPLIESMVTLGIKPRAAVLFASEYEAEILKPNIDYVREKLSSGYEIKDITGFLRAALESNYAIDAVEAEDTARQVKLKEAEQRLHREAEQRITDAKRQAIPNAKFEIQRRAALDRFARLANAEQKQVQQAFVDHLINVPNAAAISARFSKEGFDDPMVASTFRVFLIGHFEIPEPTEVQVREHVAAVMAEQLAKP